MKKIFLPFLLFTIYCSLFTATSLALEPVIVTDHRHTYPTDSGQDQNYIPSDPNAVDTVSLIKNVQISQSFDPIISGTDVDGNPVYAHQTIDHVQGNLDSSRLNTEFYRQNYDYFARPVFDPYAAATTSYLTSNSSRHSLPASVQKCLISNQIVDISTFIAGGNSICIDREIRTPTGPIRVGEIISALINAGNRLYYPDSNCPPNQTPKSFPTAVNRAIASIKFTYHLSTDQYRQIYLTGIEPVCTNSLAQSVEHCDQNDQGQKSNCKTEIRNLPLAAVPAQDIYKNYRPSSVEAVSRNYNQTENSPSATDRPNPISWLARFFNLFFDGKLKETKTFSGPYVITTKVDSRQVKGLESFETTSLNLLPNQTIKTKNLKDLPPSGTNEVTTDPGLANSKLTDTLYQNLTPASWHK